MENIKCKTPANCEIETMSIMDQTVSDKIRTCSKKKLNVMENLAKLKSSVHAGTNELVDYLREREREVCKEIDEQCFQQYNDIDEYMLDELSTVLEDSPNLLMAKSHVGEGNAHKLKELHTYFKKQVVFISNFKDVKEILQSSDFGEVKIVNSDVEAGEKETIESKQFSVKGLKEENLKQYQSIKIVKEPTVSEASFEVIESDMEEIRKLEEELLTDEDDIDFVSETENTEIPSWQPIEVPKGKKSPKTLVEACLNVNQSPAREKKIPEFFVRIMNNIKNNLDQESKECAKIPSPKFFAEPTLELQKQLEGFKMSKEPRFLRDEKQHAQSSKADVEKSSGIKTPTLQKDVLAHKWLAPRPNSVFIERFIPRPRTQKKMPLFSSQEDKSSKSQCSIVSYPKFFPELSPKESNIYPVQSKEEKLAPWALLKSSFDVYLHKNNTEKWIHTEGDMDKWLYSYPSNTKICKAIRMCVNQIDSR